MKKTFYLFSLSLVIALSAFAYINDRLTGQWLVETPEGSVNVDFAADGSFKVTANGQPVNEGKYKLVKDTFFTTDNTCGALEGKYLLNFHTPDSASFKVITDPCSDRQAQVNGVILVRAKAEKK